MVDQNSFWNERFSKEGFMYGLEPNNYIKSQHHVFRPQGDVLCLAEGEGRNALFLAREGFKVTALDASEIGLAKCATLAQKENLEIALECLDLNEWMPTKKYDAIVASFMHLPEPLRTKTFETAIDALNTKGVLVMEFFSKNQLLFDYSSGGPKELSLLYSVEELQPLFLKDNLAIVTLNEEEDTLNEGWGHQGKARLIRLHIQKKD